MAKEVVRIGRLYVESVGSDLQLLAVEYSDKENVWHGVDVSLKPQQVFELMAVLERHVSRLVKEKACVTCVNFDGVRLEGCMLPADQRVKCVNNNRSLYAPAYPTA